MDYLTTVIDLARPALPTAVAIALVVAVLAIAHRLLARLAGPKSGPRFGHQLIMLGLSFVGLLVVVTALPVAESTRGQLMSLIGIIISAAIALSSTTFLGNAMAGIMLRAVRSFRIGDFIRCGENFGRVTERGLFHTEIQNEDRELITLPNLYLVTHPVTTLRKSGTVISTRVSLGYDVPRGRVKPLLLEAISASGLEDPFVYIVNLGDFSVTYRAAGLLTEVRHVISTQARLRAKVLDALHGGGVEIVSPTFMNQRVVPEERAFIPAEPTPAEAGETSPVPDDVVFDKAEQAESLESMKAHLEELLASIAARKAEIKQATEADKAALQELVKRDERVVVALEAAIKRRTQAVSDED